jgi:NTE family protein
MSTAADGGLVADIVLEGGGVKGIALVGAISVLAERGYRFERVAGTSAGAIVGSLIAADIKPTELRDLMQKIDYRAFRDANFLDRFGPPGQLASLLLGRGVYEGKYLRNWVSDRLAAHGVHNFKDLRRKDSNSSLPVEQDYKLVVMASDVSQGRLRRLPWDCAELYGCESDDVVVADAVRASMSIPFFYKPAVVQHATNSQKSWLVDGGMLSNFPVTVFDRSDNQSPRWPTFGIKLSMQAADLQGERFKIKGSLSLAKALLGTMTGWYDAIHVNDPDVLARTIFVDTFGVRATDFDLDSNTSTKLYDNGRKAAERFLDGGKDHPAWDFDAYKTEFRPGHS